MPPEERSPEWDVSLVAAARTAASWAHARRASWTDAPLVVVVSHHAAVPRPTVPAPVAHLPSPLPFVSPLVELPDARAIEQPSIADRTATKGRTLTELVAPWLPRAAAAAALAVAATGSLYLWRALPTSTPRVKRPAATKTVPSAPPPKPTAALHLTSTPTAAQVLVDGKLRGVTPLTLSDLSPGRHTVAITATEGTIQRVVTVVAGETAEINEAIFSGWAAVYAPFDLTISENGRVLRPDDRNQLMLPPGTHSLRVVNQAVGFDEIRQVDVKPGDTTVVRLTPPSSTLTLTATEPSEVWLDGARLGETPLEGVAAAVGSHELLVKRNAGGDRRFTVTVGVKPFTMHVAFN